MFLAGYSELKHLQAVAFNFYFLKQALCIVDDLSGPLVPAQEMALVFGTADDEYAVCTLFKGLYHCQGLYFAATGEGNDFDGRLEGHPSFLCQIFFPADGILAAETYYLECIFFMVTLKRLVLFHVRLSKH